MSDLVWRRAQKADTEPLAAFLLPAEELWAGFSGRLMFDGRLRLPTVLRGSVWVAERGGSGGILGALLCHPTRLAFPALPADPGADRGLALASGSWRPAQAIGLTRDVVRYRSAFGLEPLSIVDYRIMARPCPRANGFAAPRDEASADAAEGRAAESPMPRGVIIRRADLSDLDAVLPLQEAYEREEVLTRIHRFNARACRASLARALGRQIVMIAEEGGRVVAKAGTNARGMRVDQVGGVYTIPQLRGRGIARSLMSALLAEIEGSGRRASLFVKPHNAPALSLYRGLGFEELDDFRAEYYER